MKLVLNGHDQRYTVEQSLMNLFPGELPVYEPVLPGDETWARITCREEEGRLLVTADISFHGRVNTAFHTAVLSGTDFAREGQRRHAIGACFYQAALEFLAVPPPWGMLTGVRPDKPAAWAVMAGNTPAEARKMLEETYFVSPSRAALAAETGAMAAAAAAGLGPRDIAVYIGVPFCPTRCAYCSFVSQSVEKSFPLIAPYVDAVSREIRAGGGLVRRLGLRVRALYMGGGTPTTLTADQLDRVLGAFQASFDTSACGEITVEAGRPDTIDPAKMAVLARHGVDRVSVNPQSMNDSVLEKMGRPHTARDIRRAYEQVRNAGKFAVNMDLIAGLPGDSPAGFAASLGEVMELGPENITVHTLALKKGSRLMEHPEELPGDGEVEVMLNAAWETLREAGYVPYYLYRQKYMSGSFENVGWAKPGYASLYNIAMMEELHTILALGGGGVTKQVWPGTGKIERIANPKYPQEYLRDIDRICAGKRELIPFLAETKGG